MILKIRKIVIKFETNKVVINVNKTIQKVKKIIFDNKKIILNANAKNKKNRIDDQIITRQKK